MKKQQKKTIYEITEILNEEYFPFFKDEYFEDIQKIIEFREQLDLIDVISDGRRKQLEKILDSEIYEIYEDLPTNFKIKETTVTRSLVTKTIIHRDDPEFKEI